MFGIAITIQGNNNEYKVLLYPTENHLNITLKINIDIIPNQKEGIEIHNPIIKSITFFILLFLNLCIIKDRGIDTPKTIIIVNIAISKVNGNLSKIKLETDSPYLNELPKSPKITLFPH